MHFFCHPPRWLIGLSKMRSLLALAVYGRLGISAVLVCLVVGSDELKKRHKLGKTIR